MPRRLLIIEDDNALCEMLAMHFEDLGFAVSTAPSAQSGLEQLQAFGVDLLLLDQQLPDGLGSELIGKLLETDPHLPILMMTGKHDLELAIEAIQSGAADFVHKPIETEDLTQAVERLLREREALGEISHAPSAEPAPDEPQRDLIGRSEAMLSVSKAIARSARSQATVLSGPAHASPPRRSHGSATATGPAMCANSRTC